MNPEFIKDERKNRARRVHKIYRKLAKEILARVKTSKTLKRDFDWAFFPTSVCDRRAVKGSKTHSIENLTKIQNKFREILKNFYLVTS